MKVIVKNFLNVRVGKPSVNAPCYQYIAPGSELTVEDVLYDGDEYEGSSKWLRDKAGNYYWAGGVEKESIAPVKIFPKVKLNYNSIINLKPEIKETKGEGITIAIMDTGCYSSNSLSGAIKRGYNGLNNNENDYSDSSTEGHGTFVAGIIAAREKTDSEIIGVAPKANLIVIKIIENKGALSKNVRNGLQWILDNDIKIDILNLSFNFNPGDKESEFDTLFLALKQRGILIIAAGQNNAENYSSQIFYPARSPSVVGVGSLLKTDKPSNGQLNPQIKFIVPDLSYQSLNNYSNSLQDPMSGCSFSSALVSGVAALIASYMKKSNTLSGSVFDNLIKETEPLTSFNETKLTTYHS